MTPKTQALNDSGSSVAVYTNVSGSPDRAKVTIIDTEKGQMAQIVGITAIKTLRDFLSESIRKFEFEEAADTLVERKLENGS